MRLLNLLIRPKINEQEAIAIVQQAAAAKGWHLHVCGPVSRHLGCYDGFGFIDGTEVTVFWMGDGRSRALVCMNRSDELNDEDSV